MMQTRIDIEGLHLVSFPRSLEKAGYSLLDLRDSVELNLGSPRSIHGPHSFAHERADIGREVRYEHVLAVKDKAVRPQKAGWRSVFINASEVAELGDDPALLRLEHHNLV